MTAYYDRGKKEHRTHTNVYHKTYNHHLVSKKSPCKPNLSYFFERCFYCLHLCVYVRFFVVFIYSIPHLSVCPILSYWMGFKNSSKIRSSLFFSIHVSFTRVNICRVFMVWELRHTVLFFWSSFIGKKVGNTISLYLFLLICFQHSVQLYIYVWIFFFDASFVLLSLKL